ncbi:very short patch repair endonuclease [Ancylobacter sp.]|uniref:very short patch repair endonuclease n=1 Tax=Ancylobacter sp. TaxID=1872567 RepID=UPI003C7D5BE0
MDVATRSRMMSGIRAKDTKPEMIVRRGLHSSGLRYTLHVRSLPGTPDIVFPRKKAVIFVHGCFWHGHDCHLHKVPDTRKEFWSQKIDGNRIRDVRHQRDLSCLGWRYLVVWECALRGKTRRPVDSVIEETAEWVRSGLTSAEIGGREGGAR